MSSVDGSGPKSPLLASLSIEDNSLGSDGHVYTRLKPSEKSCCDKKKCLSWYMRVVYIGLFAGSVLALVGASLSDPLNRTFYAGVITLGASGVAAIPGAACKDRLDS